MYRNESNFCPYRGHDGSCCLYCDLNVGTLYCRSLFEPTADGLACEEHESVAKLTRKLEKGAINLLAQRNGDKECDSSVETRLSTEKLQLALKDRLSLYVTNCENVNLRETTAGLRLYGIRIWARRWGEIHPPKKLRFFRARELGMDSLTHNP